MDGERHDQAVERWKRMVAEVFGLEAAMAFASAAGAVLTAQVRLAQSELAADARSAPVRWKAVGRAELTLEIAEAALRAAASPRARPDSSIVETLVKRADGPLSDT